MQCNDSLPCASVMFVKICQSHDIVSKQDGKSQVGLKTGKK